MYGIGVNAAQHAGEQGHAVAEREQADVLDNVAQPVQKENDPDQEQQVVVAGDHVFRAEVHQGRDCGAVERLQKPCVSAGDAMREQRPVAERQQRHDCDAVSSVGFHRQQFSLR